MPSRNKLRTCWDSWEGAESFKNLGLYSSVRERCGCERKNEDYKDADYYYSQLYEHYPNSALAPKAIKQAIICKQLSTGGSCYDCRSVEESRKLIDVAQNVVVSMHDCGTAHGIETESLRGRVLVTGQGPLTEEEAARMKGCDGVRVRSPLTCAAPSGVCRLCYGLDLSQGKLVEVCGY